MTPQHHLPGACAHTQRQATQQQALHCRCWGLKRLLLLLLLLLQAAEGCCGGCKELLMQLCIAASALAVLLLQGSCNPSGLAAAAQGCGAVLSAAA
jgi:hypothetical protein